GGRPGKDVPVDLTLDKVNPGEFDLIVFGGGNVKPFFEQHQLDLAAIVNGARGANKPVAAICKGEDILNHLGGLKGKAISFGEYVEVRDSKTNPEVRKEPVVVSAPFITSGDAAYAKPFADALIEALRKQP